MCIENVKYIFCAFCNDFYVALFIKCAQKQNNISLVISLLFLPCSLSIKNPEGDLVSVIGLGGSGKLSVLLVLLEQKEKCTGVV